jgi:hypothetical protein
MVKTASGQAGHKNQAHWRKTLSNFPESLIPATRQAQAFIAKVTINVSAVLMRTHHANFRTCW